MAQDRPWLAHEDIDRPFDRWTWLDECPMCLVALKREAQERSRLELCPEFEGRDAKVLVGELRGGRVSTKPPHFYCWERLFCLKTEHDRVVVTSAYLAEALSGGAIEELCCIPDDRVREVFVVGDGYLLPPARWYSVILGEQDRRFGRQRRWWRTKL